MALQVLLFVYCMQVIYTYRSFVDHMHQTEIPSLPSCTARHMISELIYPLVVTLAIPFYEFVVYPLFRNYVPRMMKRIAMGMIIMAVALLGLLVLDSVGHARTGGAVCVLYVTHNDQARLAPIEIGMVYLIPIIVLMTFGELLTFIPG